MYMASLDACVVTDMCLMKKPAVTRHTAHLDAGMQTQWQGALASISGGHALQSAAVVICLTVGCVIVSNLKHYIPLVSSRIGDNDDELETPRLPVVLCPHSTMVCTS